MDNPQHNGIADSWAHFVASARQTALPDRPSAFEALPEGDRRRQYGIRLCRYGK
jgi:hypothetical protein